MSHIVPLKNVLREDETAPSMDRGELLKNAPATDGGTFLVQRPWNRREGRMQEIMKLTALQLGAASQAGRGQPHGGGEGGAGAH